MGPVQPPMVDRIASAWFHTLSTLQAKPRCPLDGSAPWVAAGGSLYLGPVLLLSTCVERCKLLPTPLRDAHWTSRPQEKR
jgi:hypothetical protein